MNETLEIIYKRHSARTYLDKEISNEDREYIYKAILESPSAGNMQAYSVIEIKDKDKLARLAVLNDNQPFIAEGKMVLCFVVNPLRYYETYNECHDNKITPTLADFYLCMNDALIAAQTAVIAAESLGIGSCYIGDIIENYEEVKELLKLPKYVNPVAFLVFGYRKDNPKNLPRLKKEDVFSIDEFKNDSVMSLANKYNNTDEEASKERAYKEATGIYNRKFSAPFFKEMNRSFELMIKEYEVYK